MSSLEVSSILALPICLIARELSFLTMKESLPM